MELEVGGIYCIKGFKDPLCLAISDETLLTKLPHRTEPSYLKREEFDFTYLPKVTLVDLMRSWQITSAMFDTLVGPVMRTIYRQRAKNAPAAPIPFSKEDTKYVMKYAMPAKPIPVKKKVPIKKKKAVLKTKAVKVLRQKISISPPIEVPAWTKEFAASENRAQLGRDSAIFSAIKAGTSVDEVARDFRATEGEILASKARHQERVDAETTARYNQRMAAAIRQGNSEKTDLAIFNAIKDGASPDELAENFDTSKKKILESNWRHRELIRQKKIRKKTQAKKEKIVEALRQSEPAVIMAKFKVSWHYLRKLAAANGLRIVKDETKVKEEKRSLVEEALRAGESVRSIAKRLEVSLSMVKVIKKKHFKPNPESRMRSENKTCEFCGNDQRVSDIEVQDQWMAVCNDCAKATKIGDHAKRQHVTYDTQVNDRLPTLRASRRSKHDPVFSDIRFDSARRNPDDQLRKWMQQYKQQPDDADIRSHLVAALARAGDYPNNHEVIAPLLADYEQPLVRSIIYEESPYGGRKEISYHRSVSNWWQVNFPFDTFCPITDDAGRVMAKLHPHHFEVGWAPFMGLDRGLEIAQAFEASLGMIAIPGGERREIYHHPAHGYVPNRRGVNIYSAFRYPEGHAIRIVRAPDTHIHSVQYRFKPGFDNWNNEFPGIKRA